MATLRGSLMEGRSSTTQQFGTDVTYSMHYSLILPNNMGAMEVRRTVNSFIDKDKNDTYKSRLLIGINTQYNSHTGVNELMLTVSTCIDWRE